MIPALTATQWAQRPDLRAELQAALNLPCMLAALATLREGALASLNISGFPSTMDPMQAIALVTAQKNGGLNFLKNLTSLPNLDTARMDAMRALSDPASETPPTT